MKLVKSSKWVRLRGQIGPNNEVCKLDTPVSDKERAFFVPESEREKTFFQLDSMLNLTGIPQGPTSHNPDDPWGWRFYASRTEEDMANFVKGLEKTMGDIYDKGVAGAKTGKTTLLN